MSAIATKCTCCRGNCGKIPTFDITLGTLCDACTEGVRNGAAIFREVGVSGLYAGPCGDNETEVAP